MKIEVPLEYLERFRTIDVENKSTCSVQCPYLTNDEGLRFICLLFLECLDSVKLNVGWKFRRCSKCRKLGMGK